MFATSLLRGFYCVASPANRDAKHQGKTLSTKCLRARGQIGHKFSGFQNYHLPSWSVYNFDRTYTSRFTRLTNLYLQYTETKDKLVILMFSFYIHCPCVAEGTTTRQPLTASIYNFMQDCDPSNITFLSLTTFLLQKMAYMQKCGYYH